MSRIGRQPVPVPSGVTVTAEAGRIAVKGPKGELTWSLPAGVAARVEGGRVTIEAVGEEASALQGLARTQVANMISGVTTGYSRELELQGVGFKASLSGNTLTLQLGYSHPVVFTAPPGITLEVKENRITVRGIDKQKVGDTAARIRDFYKPEPYKGKGIRYVNEYVRRKAGKTVA